MNLFQQKFASTESKSDKIFHHGYHRIYSWFLNNIRQDNINLLEIGLDKKESLVLWQQYFPNASIYGIDINEKDVDSNVVKFFKVDQSNDAELDKFKKDVGVNFDLIIDDGSHVPGHQIKTLNSLWSLLKPRGVYIIEDIETSYWGASEIYGYSFDSNNTSENIIYQLKNCIDQINSEFIPSFSPKQDCTINHDVLQDIEMITFGYNSVILIKKDKENFGQFYQHKVYRFIHKINIRSLRNRILKKIKMK